MPSNSLNRWNTTRAQALDQIAHAHRRVGGSGRGRRYATEQINHAYTMLLSSQFQGFCRDLHSEAVDHIVRSVTPVPLQAVVRADFMLHRKLDSGNPNPSNIGADFNRLGLRFFDQIRARSRWNIGRIDHLEDLNRWRNAIAHQAFDPAKLGGIIHLRLAMVKQWRAACEQLAVVFDDVLGDHVVHIAGVRPW
ncbi:MAG: hypothetical protein GXX96_39550 [Planctomycetaceae bacterium]|nr:hypothetical protein [Planctomycetaceae bacterium]